MEKTAHLTKHKIEHLIALANTARRNAYVPYSGMSVGAALLTEEGEIFTGCNVENAALSPGICAERTALCKAVSAGYRRFSALAVIGGPLAEAGRVSTLFWPCGVCRQTLAEFCSEDFLVITAKSEKEYQTALLSVLLPHRFSLHGKPDADQD